jgi:choice-of-anchor B domain-containing protein
VRTVVGWHHEESGREVAFVNVGPKTTIVEVSDPESPQVIGDIRSDEGIVGEPAIYRDHLYVFLGGKLGIFDLTSLPTAPDPPVRVLPDALLDLGRSGRLFINPETGFAYILSGQIVALDLKDDPEAPEQVFVWNPGPPPPQNLECVIYHGPDDRFEGHEICFGAAYRRSMVIYDVTDKGHPVKLARAFYRPFNNAWHSAVSADHRVLLVADSHDEHNPGGNTRTFLFDLSSLTAPVHFNTYQGPTRGRDLHLEVRGRYAFLANGRGGLRVLDLRQVADGRVREAGFFDMEPEEDSSDWFGANSVDVLPSGIVIVGSMRQGLYVLRPRLQ